jgi:ferredoxin
MPQSYPVEVFTPEDTIQVDVAEDAYLLDAIRQAGQEFPGSCLQGWSLTCAARPLAGEVDQADAARYLLEDREAVRVG